MQHVLALQASDNSTTYIVLALGGFVLLYLSVLRPMMRKRKDPLEAPPMRSGLAQQRAVERDMQSLLVEYEQMIRNMTAGLDTRAARLELLIREADEKLAELRNLTAGSGKSRAESFESASSPSSVASSSLSPAPPAIDPRHAEVYAMVDQGLPTVEVARRLGRPSGEIELILHLRNRINRGVHASHE